MGQSSTKSPAVCSDVLWQLSTATASHYPSTDDIEATLLDAPHTVALGRDVCRIIAAYSRCLIDDAFITSSGLIFPASTSPTPAPPLRLRPPLPSSASCCIPLPPSALAFGLNDSAPKAQTDRRRAVILIYSAHSFTLSHALHFPFQQEFLSPHPSVSSLLLLPPPFPLAPSSSSLLAAVDDVGHLCIWHWPSAQLLYLFHSKPPVFYASSSLTSLPYGRLALLLAGCPGPQHPPSRLHVFDLVQERTYKSAVDSEQHAEQIFPRSLFFPPHPATAGEASPTTASAAKAKSLPYSVYSNDSIFRWHVNHAREAIEVRPVLLPPLPTPTASLSSTPSQSLSPPLPSFLHTSSTSWQPLGHPEPVPGSYRWRHRCECLRWDAQGRVVRVEGGEGVVRVFIGHHTDRSYSGYFDFPHSTEGDDEEDAEDEDAEAEEQKDGVAAPVSPPTAPIRIPRLPAPFILLLNRRAHRRRSPPNLQVSAAFTSSSMLVVSAHRPQPKGEVKDRVVTGWTLTRQRDGEGVKAECRFVRRMRSYDEDVGSLLCVDAPAKIAQRMKGAKQFLLG